MKKIVMYKPEVQTHDVLLAVGDRINLVLTEKSDSIKGAFEYPGFTVQAVAKAKEPNEMIINAICGKSVATILMNNETGKRSCLMISDSVEQYEVDAIHVLLGYSSPRKKAVLSHTATYKSTQTHQVPVDLAPGMTLRTTNADYTVEYVAQDGSILFRSQKSSEHPVKTVLIGMKNAEFWKSVRDTFHMVDV